MNGTTRPTERARRRGMPAFQREQGSRDWRMLPVAIAMWAASLGMHTAFEWAVAQPMPPTFTVGVAGCAMAGVTAGVMAVPAIPLKPHMRAMATMLICAAITAGIATLAFDLHAWHDPASIQARGTPATVTVHAHIDEPVTAADRRGYDCQATAQTRVLDDGIVRRASTASIRVYATGEDCAGLTRGAVIAFTGTITPADWGNVALWLNVQGTDPVRRIRDPSMADTMATAIQEAFFAVTERLSDQGRVLVPGLTLGLLGQDHIDDGAGPAIDDTYAATLEDQFRRAGIMHLMAVSGGHFALIAELTRRLGSWLLLDRRIRAALLAATYIALAALVFPSASVTRALIMGLIASAGVALGRRSQPISALSWTVVIVLVADPAMSRSYGFALSSAAVLGIVICSPALEKALRTAMPKPLAQMVAMTVAAQLFTLPIQILMEPELPILSVAANLLVAPVVGWSTITGLVALLAAWASPELAYGCAWLSSCGTIVMERAAVWLGGTDVVTLPWSSGVAGAVSMIIVEAAVASGMVVCARWWKRRRVAQPGLPGERIGATWRNRLAIWFDETERVLVQRYGEIGDYGQNSSGERPGAHRIGRRRLSQRADRAGPVPAGSERASRQRTHRTGRHARRPVRLRRGGEPLAAVRRVRGETAQRAERR
ncbi:competence protein [Bifidobacterium eulemuris]|uniref:Competence protein n=2 Tax=Bifidobacterium eulemuris TaxID=1765219 RepID=A0A261GDN8_9BIFI|nr:competence protein [Bifidobacterium eulemuris]